MSNVTSGGVVGNRPPSGGEAAARTRLTWAAWIATLLLSNLPLVIARELLGADIPWIVPLWLATAVLLCGATFAWPALRPLRRYFAIMGVIVLANSVLYPAIRATGVWQRLETAQGPMIDLLGQRILLALLTLFVLLAAILMGSKRRELYLTAGDMAAPVQGLRLPGGRRVSWALFGPAMALLLAGLFFVFSLGQLPAGAGRPAMAIPWLPLILASAALNAFAEEGMYRAAPLAMLLPVVGGRQAIWMTALWFGLGHFYGGVPSGVAGLIGPGLLAVLLGKAMLDTRGMGWSWIIHVAIDTVIYAIFAITQ